MAVHRLTVPPDASPRLDAFLTRALPAVPKPELLKLLAAGKVRVNGKVAKPLRRIVGGEQVEVDDGRPDAASAPLDRGRWRVLHDDAAMFVIDKPSGLVIEPGAVPGGLIVQRLDKDTTGCLVLAKTNDAMVALQRAFEEKRIKKTYLALVWGAPPETGKLDTPYGRNPDDPRRYTSRVSSPRRARLSWVKREQFATAALLEIDLDTGRTHQIRAQLSDLGHPLLGDWLYGTAEARAAGESIGRIPLHAWKLRIDGREFVSSLPRDMEAALAALRGMRAP